MALTTLAKERRKDKSFAVKVEKSSRGLNDNLSISKSKFVHYPTNFMEYNDISHDNTEKLIVVNFSLPHSGPCRMMSHIFENMAHSIEYKGSVIFIYIDVTKNGEICSKYDIDTYPTFILFKNGIEIEKIIGANSELLEEMIHLRLLG